MSAVSGGCPARVTLAVSAARHNGQVARRHDYLDRMVTDGSNQLEWLRARARGITATDVAKLTSAAAIERTALDKLHGSGFAGNAYTEHGKTREPIIAAWVEQNFSITSSQALFHAAAEKRHLATPDGIGIDRDGSLVLAEIEWIERDDNEIERLVGLANELISELHRLTRPVLDRVSA